MDVTKKKSKILDEAINHWVNSQAISEDDALRLKASYTVTPFDWKLLAKYSLWAAICCILISVSAVLADDWLIELFKTAFNAPDIIKCLGFASLAAVLYYFGVKRKGQYPNNVYSNEAIFFLGVIATAVSIVLLGEAVGGESDRVSLLFLLAAILYGFLGLWFPSNLVWLFSLLSLGAWFGAETGYASGWGAYYLGMNYPFRFVIFGLCLLTVGSFVFTKWSAKRPFLITTKAMGLLYLFISLWIMSIFGNYGDGETWLSAKQYELFYWSVLFAIASFAAIYHGIKYEDGMTKGFGLTFLFLNLYTRYFEYFWDGTHKAIFFALLAVSFWFLGSRAEKIWQLSLIKNIAKPKPADQ